MVARLTTTDTKIKLLSAALFAIDWNTRAFVRGLIVHALDRQYDVEYGEPDRFSTYYSDIDRWD